MRYIQKGNEPRSLTEYKKDRTAYFDGYSEKDDVRRTLMEEQGYLCAYCMKRIKDVKDVKIEHIVPQSQLKRDPREALNYRIMVGVCYGNEHPGRKRNMLTCDKHRENRDIFVDPFDRNCVNKIKYLSDGTILSDDAKIDETLKETLNLNYNGADAYLMLNRKAVLDSCKKKLKMLQKQGIWKRSVLEKILHEYEKKDAEGKYIPYSGIAIAYLRKKLHKQT